MSTVTRRAYRAERRIRFSIVEDRRCAMMRLLVFLCRRRKPKIGSFNVHFQGSHEKPQSTHATSSGLQFSCRSIFEPAWRLAVAHELAHIVIIRQRRFKGRVGHGAPWRREYLRLVRYFSASYARRLRREFAREGL